MNSHTFSEVIPVNLEGKVLLIMATNQAGEGDYFLQVESTLKAMTTFQVSPEEPLRPIEGNGHLLGIPAGLGLDQRTYLPLGLR